MPAVVFVLIKFDVGIVQPVISEPCIFGLLTSKLFFHEIVLYADCVVC